MFKIKNIKNLLLFLVLSFAFLFQVSSPAEAANLFSGAKSEACKASQLDKSKGVDVANKDCTLDDASTLSKTIQDGLNLLTVVVGIIAVIMIVIGGLRFVVSDGDSGKITSARNTIIYAIIGLILVAFAQIIVRLVVDRI